MCLAYDWSQVDIVNIIFKIVAIAGFKRKVVVEKPGLVAGSIVSVCGEGRVDVVARLCAVMDWCIDHPEYIAKIRAKPKKDYPVLMLCEFWGIDIQAKRFELLRKYSFIEAVEA